MTGQIIMDRTKLNEYFIGKIHGAMYILLNRPEKYWVWEKSRDGALSTMKLNCTDDQFNSVIDVINEFVDGAIIEVKRD